MPRVVSWPIKTSWLRALPEWRQPRHFHIGEPAQQANRNASVQLEYGAAVRGKHVAFLAEHRLQGEDLARAKIEAGQAKKRHEQLVEQKRQALRSQDELRVQMAAIS